MIIQLVLLGALQVTSYQPTPAQTRPECKTRFDCDTAIGDRPTKYGMAVSQDLLANGSVHYGDILYIDGLGYRVVNDTMNSRHKKCVDLMVYSKKEEHRIGVRKLNVYKVNNPSNKGELNGHYVRKG